MLSSCSVEEGEGLCLSADSTIAASYLGLMVGMQFY